MGWAFDLIVFLMAELFFRVFQEKQTYKTKLRTTQCLRKERKFLGELEGTMFLFYSPL